MVSIPELVVPDGYNFLLIHVSVGIKCDPYPAPNWVFTRRVSGTRCHLEQGNSVIHSLTYILIVES
jgi:hypothetical protein